MALQDIDTRLGGATPYSANLHQGKCKPGPRMQFGKPSPRTRPKLAQGAAKLAFLTGIAATVLLAWQGIALHVQQFSVRPDAAAPVASTVARWVGNLTAPLKQTPPATPAGASTFAAESAMTAGELMERWAPLIGEASRRFGVPARWIRAVLQMESAGRTMSSAAQPITSTAGAMGIMQLMPGTYREMRLQYHLGANPYDPHDNLFAGAAYLHRLYGRYGYPAMFAAYNDGPGHLDKRLERGGLLPAETRNYVTHIVARLARGGDARLPHAKGVVARFTRPNGKPVKIELAQITSLRIPFAGEYAPDVHAVITIGSVYQAVRESYNAVKTAILAARAPESLSDPAFHRTVRQGMHPARIRHSRRHRGTPDRLAESDRIGEAAVETNSIGVHSASAVRKS